MTAYEIQVPTREVAASVAIYLGIPFGMGIVSRWGLVRLKGETWYMHRFIPFISPFTLFALLFTIVVMFSLKGDAIVRLPLQVLQLALPLGTYFLLMFGLSFGLNKLLGIPYDKNAAISFTATGNNFELAIAVSIAIFGIHSPQAFVGVVGPLIEVPALIALVRMSTFLHKKWYAP